MSGTVSALSASGRSRVIVATASAISRRRSGHGGGQAVARRPLNSTSRAVDELEDAPVDRLVGAAGALDDELGEEARRTPRRPAAGRRRSGDAAPGRRPAPGRRRRARRRACPRRRAAGSARRPSRRPCRTRSGAARPTPRRSTPPSPTRRPRFRIAASWIAVDVDAPREQVIAVDDHVEAAARDARRRPTGRTGPRRRAAGSGSAAPSAARARRVDVGDDEALRARSGGAAGRAAPRRAVPVVLGRLGDRAGVDPGPAT